MTIFVPIIYYHIVAPLYIQLCIQYRFSVCLPGMYTLDECYLSDFSVTPLSYASPYVSVKQEPPKLVSFDLNLHS